MSIQFRYFMVPTMDTAEAEQELNRFLRSVRVLTVRHEFVQANGSPCWYAAVEYLQGGGGEEGNEAKTGRKGKDYREILPPEDFAIYSQLREWRKKRAEQEQVPVYTILTNEQLAKIAGFRPDNLSGLREIEGIGEARVTKYGSELLVILSAHAERKDEEQRQPVPQNP
jgi:superfamily II DNA helicase RecQ